MATMKKYYLSAVLVLICSIVAFGQQRPQYSLYMVNPFMLNPALSGTEDYTDIRLGFRKQWVGFEGAPRTMYLSAHTSLGKARVTNNRSKNKKNGFHGVGAIISNDAIGPTKTTVIDLAYSYHLQLAPNLFASLGIMGGLQQYSLNANLLHTANPDDPLLVSSTNTSLADVNSGFWIYSDKFFVGGSMVQVMPQKLYNEKNGSVTAGKLSQHYFVIAGYKFPMGYDFALIPSVCVKAVSPAPVSYDINAKLRYKDFLWGGISYRNTDAIAFLAGVVINNTWDISYAYDYTTSKIRLYSSGSHEIVVGYRLKTKNRIICPSNFW
jgi:type IX secretion system PorP/SprF family membrane protein